MPEPSESYVSPSLTDPVTELYNRKQLFRRAQEQVARCDRTRETIALVLWDIDGFIEFNNQYGQAAGDQFLRKVAEQIRQSVRTYDEAFRSGPDEFCALLMPADVKTAEEVTRRVSEAVSKKLFADDPTYAHHRFSISHGIVTYPGTDKHPEALYHSATQALYRYQRVEGVRS
ncbi:MAG: GGDEF domain-containing protein [Elusimicrobia bacterium]|nr:GGDEF domain-containing protein [Candidatus Obscuribacterium magneticum]